MADLGKLLKDYPEYGKKAGDVVAVYRNVGGGNVVTWKAASIGINPEEVLVSLKVDEDVKLLSDQQQKQSVIDFLKKEKELGKKPEANQDTKPENATKPKSKPNWVLIGGIILVGYFLFKQK